MTDPLLGPAQIRQIAARLGVRPTKSLGQNFLHDANTIRRIVRTAGLAGGETALEIGAGLGSLTLGLLAAGHPVVAVEVDPVLASALPATVTERAPRLLPLLRVIHADALRLTPEAAAGAGSAEPTALVANLPYNVAVPVLLRLLAGWPTIRHGLVMVQAEVADRLTAAAGEASYGVPSVKLAWYASAHRAGPVPRAVFWPVPNVDSTLVAFTRRPPPAGDREATFAVVDAAFAQRRKTLRAALAGWAGSPRRAEELLRAAGVDPGLRGEALEVAAFARIADAAAATGVVRPATGTR